MRDLEIQTRGMTFRGVEDGPEDGPLALLLHGFPDSHHTWRHLLGPLADAGYRAVAPAMRGYAPSDVPADGRYQTAALSLDAIALTEALGGGDDAVLIGHDWGAVASYGAAAHSPTTSAPNSSTTAPPITTTPEPTTSTTAPFPGWPAIARTVDIPVGGTLKFTFGSGSAHAGAPGLLFQPSPGVFVALDTICTHLNIVPCNLNGSKLVCPQHGSEFALSTGAVINGPAVSPLARGTVSARADGFVWFEGDA